MCSIFDLCISYHVFHPNFYFLCWPRIFGGWENIAFSLFVFCSLCETGSHRAFNCSSSCLYSLSPGMIGMGCHVWLNLTGEVEEVTKLCHDKCQARMVVHEVLGDCKQGRPCAVRAWSLWKGIQKACCLWRAVWIPVSRYWFYIISFYRSFVFSTCCLLEPFICISICIE